MNSDVDGAVEKILISLVQNENVLISKQDASRLALWAAKTAASRALIDPEPRAIPSEHYIWIKEHLLPPPHTHVWLTRSEYTNDAIARHMRFNLIGEDGNPADQLMHMTFVWLGHLCAVIFGCANHENEINSKELIDYFDQRNFLKIFPNSYSGYLASTGRHRKRDIISIGDGLLTLFDRPFPAGETNLPINYLHF